MNVVKFLRRNVFARAASLPGKLIELDHEAPHIYAIGDVHGCFDLLLDVERQIIGDASRWAGEKWIVMVGDYVDRGPSSAQVLDHLLEPIAAPNFRRFCLAGNHELAMARFLANPAKNKEWLGFGGKETLASYGIPRERLETQLSSSLMRQLLEAYVPEEHRRFLGELPWIISSPHYVFSHAGLRPGVAVEQQGEGDLLWARHDFINSSYEEFARTIVHGHTPLEQPVVLGNRIAIDTGAYATGRLTAVRLTQAAAPLFLSSSTSVAHKTSLGA